MIKYELNNINLLNRVDYIKQICTKKKVLHLGATDAPETINAVFSDRLLHKHLNQVSEHLVGIDISQDMIEWLADNCGVNNIYYGNIENIEDYPQEDFDVIVAGEILEHLSNPGKALDSIYKIAKPSTKFIITVPNAYSFKGFCRASFNQELIHRDHILHHSFYTLKSLLERHGFSVIDNFSFVNGGKGIAACISNFILKFTPQLAEGIGVVCAPTKLHGKNR